MLHLSWIYLWRKIDGIISNFLSVQSKYIYLAMCQSVFVLYYMYVTACINHRMLEIIYVSDIGGDDLLYGYIRNMHNAFHLWIRNLLTLAIFMLLYIHGIDAMYMAIRVIVFFSLISSKSLNTLYSVDKYSCPSAIICY